MRISAVRVGRVNLTETRFYLATKSENIDNFLLRDGDLLFTRYNGNPNFVGVCGVVRGLAERYVYPDKLIRVRLDRDRVVPGFIEMLMAAPQVRTQLAPHIKSAAGQHGISGKDLKNITLPVPSMKFQLELVERTYELLKRTQRTGLEAERASALIDRLERATRAKAFRGELVASGE